jgi:hypothetical protein
MKYLIGDIEIGGFGAMYARRKLIMQIAEAFNREPVFRFKNYVYEDPFLPLPVTLNDLKNKKINEVKKFTFEDVEDEVLFFDFDNSWGYNDRYKYQCWSPKGESYLFYSGKLYNKLQYKQEYSTEINNFITQIKKDWSIDSFKNIIGLHFRRGDKVIETPYMSEQFVINFIKQTFNTSKHYIFITSDDYDYILFLIKKYPEINFIYDLHEKRYGQNNISNMQLVISNPNLKHEETLTFIKNIEILKQCYCVVGCYNVQLTKIGGCINSFINNKSNLYLINPHNNNLEVMGNSVHTS